MKQTNRIIVICGLLFFVAQCLFLVNIQFPRAHNFDEYHYVPAAKNFLELHGNQNWEHPPLGKMLIAVGIALGGDRPFGWRLMSTVFGAITLIGMYFLGFALFRDEKVAIFIALITLFNQLLYVQSRIAMLDTFMFGFLVWALVSFFSVWDPIRSKREIKKLFLWTGIFLGLSMSCKWFSVVPWLFCLFLVLSVRILQHWGVSFLRSAQNDWYSLGLWKGISAGYLSFALIFVPFAIYFITFLPVYLLNDAKNSMSIFDFFHDQLTMYRGQLRVMQDHPYMSHWSTWALMLRPIWFAFDKEGPDQEWVRGVLLLGNPVVMWGGLVAVLFCLWSWIKDRSRQAFLIVMFYAVFYFCWTIIPRKVSFYYYYYPAGMMLGPALGYLVFNGINKTTKRVRFYIPIAILALTFCFFVYFFPLISALRIDADLFRKWMWLSSWI